MKGEDRMQQEEEAQVPAQDTSLESFLGGFDRVPMGLDPTQVYSHFLKMSAQLAQLEERAKQVSAPLVLEAALREAADVRTQSAQAAERSYNEIVQAAQKESEQLRADAERQATGMLGEARSGLADVQKQAQELLETARLEASRVQNQVREDNESAEQELERLCVDLAALIQRMLERRKADSGDSPADTPAVAGAAAAAGVGAALGTGVASPSQERPPAESPTGPPPSESPTGLPPHEPAAPQSADSHQAQRSDAELTANQQGKEGFRLPSWLDN